MQKFKVKYFPFPDEIKDECYGFTVQKQNLFLIAINSNRPPEQQRITLKHELSHILLDHFNDPRPVEEIEEEAIVYGMTMKDEEFNRLMEWKI